MMVSCAQPALFFWISIEINSSMQNSLSSLQGIFSHAWKPLAKARVSKGSSPVENLQWCLKIPAPVRLPEWLHIYGSNAEMRTSGNSRGWMENPGPASSNCGLSQLHRVCCRKIWNILSSTDCPRQTLYSCTRWRGPELQPLGLHLLPAPVCYFLPFVQCTVRSVHTNTDLKEMPRE